MAASVFTIFEGRNNFIYNIRETGAAETDTIVINLSDKTGPLGAAPSKLRIDEIWWTVNTFNYVFLEFDRDTDVELDYFSGQGYMDYRPYGGKTDNGTGGTGDLLLTSDGAGTGAYSLIIAGRFKQ